MIEKDDEGAVEDVPASQPHDETEGLSTSQAEDRREKGFLSRIAQEFSFIRGNFLLLILSWIIIDFTSEMAHTYYPLYVQALGGTAATVGLIGSVSSIISALVRFPGGYLTDKYGRRWLISSLTFVMAFSYLFYVFAPNWQTIFLGAIIRSLCSIYSPALDAMIMDSLPAKKRGMGYSLLNLITSVSTTPSPLIAGLLYLNFGLLASTRIGFSVLVMGILVAAFLRLRLKETIKVERHIDRKELLRSFAGARVFVEGIKVWKKVPRAALALLIIFTIFTVPNAMMGVIIVFYITSDLGISPVGLPCS